MRNLLFLLLFITISAKAQQTPFEKSAGTESATYFQAIDFYKKLDKASTKLSVNTMGLTDAGFPLHLVLISADGIFNPLQWHKQKKAVILVINGIHRANPMVLTPA